MGSSVQPLCFNEYDVPKLDFCWESSETEECGRLGSGRRLVMSHLAITLLLSTGCMRAATSAILPTGDAWSCVHRK